MHPDVRMPGARRAACLGCAHLEVHDSSWRKIIFSCNHLPARVFPSKLLKIAQSVFLPFFATFLKGTLLLSRVFSSFLPFSDKSRTSLDSDLSVCRNKALAIPGRKQKYKKDIRARPAECDPDVDTSVIERQMKIFACSEHVENAHQPSNLANARMRCLLNHAELDLPPQRVSTIARYDLLHALLT